MPRGKTEGVRCVQLDAGNRCMIFGRPERPAVCAQFAASMEMCGDSQHHAMTFLARLERDTSPA